MIPKSWYCWVYLIQFLSREMGYRVIAVDKPGYGETRVGKDLVNYSIKSTCRDLNELVKTVVGREKAIFIGQDWGSQTCWMMSLYFPERVEAVVGISVPFFPPKAKFHEQRDVATHLPFLSYQVLFFRIDLIYRLRWQREILKSSTTTFQTSWGVFGRENTPTLSNRFSTLLLEKA